MDLLGGVNMKRLTFKLEDTGEPLYLQLYRYIQNEIASGRLRAGERLPSIRELSSHLGISRTPVALAYEQLQAEGYVRSRAKSGMFVAEWESSDGDPEKTKRRQEPSDTRRAALSQQAKYDFGYGSVDVTQFPLAKWRKWMNRCLSSNDRRLLMYGDMQGERELRIEIARYVHQFRGVRCDPEQIVVGAGTYHSLGLLFSCCRIASVALLSRRR
jgi:GntR family transcriptional regulator / MocR family aminotransferase